MKIGSWYEIEEWMDAKNAIGGRGFWTRLENPDDDGPYHDESAQDAGDTARVLLHQGRKIRLVSVTRTVCQIG